MQIKKTRDITGLARGKRERGKERKSERGGGTFNNFMNKNIASYKKCTLEN
jgi:hypothetical protein